ncbi:helix-turn-helix transcriptional regulator [Jeotgalibacillus aurantiacus]|uniref:helix-turn-helix transcriptional regulator n=1 Tax=Jeotgalibacillus aurantiacus TaxID=2763266 RepID=UPI001D09E87A|nr:helix-turn-helix transcriptional regulator [Jeotgalibacillus aurantiacus]
MTLKTFRTIRRLSDMTATEFAMEIGVSRQLVNHIEQGRKSITRTTATKVRQAFGDDYVNKVEQFIMDTTKGEA